VSEVFSISRLCRLSPVSSSTVLTSCCSSSLDILPWRWDWSLRLTAADSTWEKTSWSESQSCTKAAPTCGEFLRKGENVADMVWQVSYLHFFSRWRYCYWRWCVFLVRLVANLWDRLVTTGEKYASYAELWSYCPTTVSVPLLTVRNTIKVQASCLENRFTTFRRAWRDFPLLCRLTEGEI